MTLTIPEHLLNAIATERCVLFVGAGLSREAGLPTGSVLSEALANESDYPRTFPVDLLEVCEYYEAKFGRNGLIQAIREKFRSPSGPTEAHKSIASLSSRFKSIITTNYDDLLETAFRDLKQEFFTITSSKDLANVPFNRDFSVILKIHGDINKPETIVITKRDYYHFLQNTLDSALGSYIKSLLLTGTFLYVGYSLRDYNFVSLYESLQRELGYSLNKGYAIMPSPNSVETSYWNKKGIQIIDSTGREFFDALIKKLSPKKNYDAFLAYAYEDREKASSIKTKLTTEGFSVFSYEENILPGDNLSEKISDGIMSSANFIPLLSKNLIKSHWSIAELRSAKSLKNKAIIPILLEDVKVPIEVREIKYIDMRENTTGGFEDLVLSLSRVEIFTDGSCEGNPGRGGWAALIYSAGQERVLTGTETKSTNNRMELMAALRALQSLSYPSHVRFFTDSQYLRRGITEWLPNWQARGWKRKGGALANVELWQALAQAIESHEIEWHWVKGHAGHVENQRVDRLAKQAIWGK